LYLSFLLMLMNLAAATTYYVSNSGNDSNGRITIWELIDFITGWKSGNASSGNASIAELADAIGKWKGGC